MKNFKYLRFLPVFSFLMFFSVYAAAQAADDQSPVACCICRTGSISGAGYSFCHENQTIKSCRENFGLPCNPLATACNLIPECKQYVVPEPIETPSALQQQAAETVPILNIKIGGTEIKFDPVSCQAGEVCQINWLAQYIRVLYQYLIGLAGILAAAVILLGGFIWLTSFGSPEKVKQAKDYITGALTGLFLALFSYLILFTVNPNLVSLNPITFTVVDPVANSFTMGPGYKGESDTASTSGSSSSSAGGGGGVSSADINDMDPSVQDRAKQDLARAGRTGSTKRGDSGRHATGYSADYPDTADMRSYVTSNAYKTETLSWYRGKTTTAYYVKDADGHETVYVDEPVTYQNGVPYNYSHWHVEYESENWDFRPSW